MISKLPPFPGQLPLPAQNDFDLDAERFLLQVLYLNEIAACYTGYMSVGYADQCLELIKEALRTGAGKHTGEGKTIYELVALYNKAQGYHHTTRFEKAIDELDKILEAWKDNQYFCDAPAIWYQWPDSSRPKFLRYLVEPAILARADALLKLQRAGEAKDCLKQMDGPSPYKSLRKNVLEGRIRRDMGDANGVDLGSLGRKSEEIQANEKKGVRTQLRSVLIEDYQQLCETSALRFEQKVEEIKKRKEAVDLKRASDALSEACQALENMGNCIRDQLKDCKDNVSERDQVVALWVKGLSACNRLLQTLSKALDPKKIRLPQCPDLVNHVLCVVRRYSDVCLDGDARHGIRQLARELVADLDSNHDYEQSIRRGLVTGMKSLWDNLEHPVSHEPLDPGFAASVRDYLVGLLEALLVNEVVEKKKLPYHETERYKDWKYELEPPLGLEKPFGCLLRRFVATEFFGPQTSPACDSYDSQECPDGVQCTESNVTEQRSCPFSRKRCDDASYRCCNCENGKRLLDRVRHNAACSPQDKGLYHYFDRVAESNREELQRRLYRSKSAWKTPSGWGFVVLQRWNSYTPALVASEGGGYFLYHSNDAGVIDLGIVVDPGFMFVENFLRHGFGIRDVTAVLVSHDHSDHIDDFEKIVTLVHEANRHRGARESSQQPLRITAGLSGGAFRHVDSLVRAATDVFMDTRVLRPDHESYGSLELRSHDNSQRVIVTPVRAIHKDTSGEDAIGFKLDLRADQEVSIGIPCDTKWSRNIAQQYNGCCLLCVHLGSITPENFLLEDYFKDEDTVRKVLHRGHLHLPGTLWFGLEASDRSSEEGPVAEDFDPGCLVIVSEFGEELKGGLRIELVKRMARFYRALNLGRQGKPGSRPEETAPDECKSIGRRRLSMLAGDIGLTVDPVKKMIKCSCCGHFYPWSLGFTQEAFGAAEQIFYVCPACSSTISPNQMHERFGQMHERFSYDYQM
ncbi:MAG TPA: hypothetical protein GX513_12030 [Firmicutes bacterium]|nr:hypothetical protein [Bacillota bacterium]